MEEKLEDEDKFEQMLMDKYPALFHEVDGKPIPPECGISCPKGWEKIVDDLCAAINERTTSTFTYKIKKNKEYHIRLGLVLMKIKSYLYKKFNPYKGIRSAIRFNSPKPEEMARAKKKLSYKFFRLFELAYCTLTNDAYEKVPVSPPIKIAQVKEKFGTLRFYYDGGDDQIRGMVEFVEYLSSKICQETGEKGQLCKRRGTYATFSIDKAKELGYDVVNETRYL
jgi:hypothetical protein